MKRKPYSGYKDSGVAWLGTVPEHWHVKALKWVGCFRGGSGFPPEHQGQQNNALAFFKVKDIELADSEGYLGCPESTVDYTVARSLRAHVFEPGTVVFAKVGAALLLGRIRQVAAPACIDNNMMGCEARPRKARERFLYWAMHPVRFADLANPGAVPSLNESQISTWPTAFPSLDEQARIARFLDHETAKIDTLIAKQERLIELLQEKRQALISHAVTKGLNPDAPMKPSGVEWLGDVPAHWNITRLRRVADGGLINGLFKTKDAYGQGTPLVNVFDVYQDDFQIHPDALERVSVTHGELDKYSVVAGDLVFVRSSLKAEGIGVSAIVLDVPEPTVFECHLVRLRPRRNLVVPVFLSKYLNSLPARHRLVAVAQTTTMTTVAQEGIASLEVLLPPAIEQQQIVDHLDRGIGQIVAVVAKAQDSIALLREHRTALISAAVTGKIDVREVQ